MTTFTNLHLNEKILNALEKKGYTTPTPIQLQAIPHVMEGKDLLGIAQTGTGKTAAFSLPILHNLAKNPVSAKSGCMRVLILTPTRELASQIAENIEIYGKELGLRHAIIFGGVSERPQITAMQRGVDILIATPGRLLDLTNQGYIRYMQLEVFVLDEADRMLDMGFIYDIKKIIHKIPEKRQTLFFSATMPDTIADLAHSILKQPVKVEVTPQSTTVEKIDQKIFFVEQTNKPALLKTVLKQEGVNHILVFCKMKHGANRVVAHLLTHGIKAAAIHGNKSQGAREKALSDFRAGEIQVLVATDIAARGIDIPAISHVINYDIPIDPESYVHRIGRTARAGREGVAISFCAPGEVKFLREVEKVIKFRIPVDETHAYHGVAAAPAERDYREQKERRPSSRAPRSSGSAERNPRSSTRSPVKSFDRRDDSRVERSDRREAAPRRDSRDSYDRPERSRNERFGRERVGAEKTGGERAGKKIFGLFGLGKKKEDSYPRARRDDINVIGDRLGTGRGAVRKDWDSRESLRSGPSARFGEDGGQKKSFGFGWFKKSDSRESSSRSEFSSSTRSASTDARRPASSGRRKPYSNTRGPRTPSSGGGRPSGRDNRR